MRQSLVRVLIGFTIGALALLSVSSSALAIDEFPLPNPCPAGPPPGGTCQPGGITTGPDGAVWFTEENGNRIGRINTAGQITHEIPLPAGSTPAEIVTGADGRLWFAESGTNKIGAIHPTTLQISHYPSGGTTAASPDGITSGPDGNLWFTEYNTGGTSRIGRMNTAGQILNELSLPSGSGPADITVGPDNSLWFTESDADAVGRVDPGGATPSVSHPPGLQFANGTDPSGISASGGALWVAKFGANAVTRISPGGAVTGETAVSAGPSTITTGSDGALWFTESGANKIGRLTAGSPAGVLTNEFLIPTGASEPTGITPGPDGALWFTELVGNKIGRIAVAPAFVPTTPPPAVAPTTSTKKKCKVPKLKRLTVKKARKKLKRAGCKYKIRGKGRFSSSKPKAGKTTSGTVTVRFKQKRKRGKR